MSGTKILIFDPAGVGKTHLKQLLLKEDPPEKRVSTGVPDNPVRAVSYTLTGVCEGEDEWFRVNSEELLQMIGATIKVKERQSLEDEVIQEHSKMPINAAREGHTNVDIAKQTTGQGKAEALQNQMIQYINGSSGEKELKWIQFIDDKGGQLQYLIMNILPSFNQICGVTTYALKLSELLDHHQPTIESDGKPVEKSYPSPLSVREIFELYLKVLPQDVLRKKIAPTPIKMPIEWFELGEILENSSHDGILSLSECQLHAKKLHIEGDAFSAALNYLVHHNILLHYSEVLPQIVFCNPQVILTKVSELVEYHHKLRSSGDGEEESAYVARFKQWGILCKEILRTLNTYSVEGLFTADDFIKLLESCHAIATIGRREYFMPTLLLRNPLNILQYLKEGTCLAITFDNGCIPNALFCCLVAHLTNLNKASCWNVCTKSNEPLCLYRNCISFTRYGEHGIVTLIDTLSDIAIHVDKAIASREVCSEIRDCIHDGILSVCAVLGYSGVQYEDAFFCPCSAEPEPHVAIVEKKRQYIWRCSIETSKSGDLNEHQALWFAENTCRIGKDSFQL